MKSTKDSLGTRIKEYEKASKFFLPIRTPIIVRLDAKAFHTYTKGCKKPVDENLVYCMNETAKYLCENIQGCQIAYVQSDEISLLLVNYENLESQPWFGNNIQKMASISAGMASAKFTMLSDKIFGKQKLAVFDSRVFIVPKEEVNNVFIWRQNDAIRNSVQMLARSMFSHKQCDNKDQNDLKAMCKAKGTDWDLLPNQQKVGRCIKKNYKFVVGFNKKTQKDEAVTRSSWDVDNDIPVFTQDRFYIDKYLGGAGFTASVVKTMHDVVADDIVVSSQSKGRCPTCGKFPRTGRCPIKCDEYH